MLEKLYHFAENPIHMKRGVAIVSAVVLASSALAFGGVSAIEPAQNPASGWQLPADADQKKNPHPVDETLLATGRAVYKDKCARCHGPGGLGDGPDADPDSRKNMDLTNGTRSDQNADGVVFYKVWNGRRRPRMPAFNTQISEDQAWAVVAYVQSLRKK
jgi:mono/diheme cytochrome c family protein